MLRAQKTFPRFPTLLLSIVLLGLFSCSSDDDYDRKKAISAFVEIDHSAPNSDLKEVVIKLPGQQENSSWNGSSSEQNQRLENIAKTFKTKKSGALKLRKSLTIWSQFQFGYDNRLVLSPVISNGKVFLLKNNGVLTSHDLKTEKKIWSKRIFPRVFLDDYKTPKIYAAKGKIFAISGINSVVAVDQETGETIWSKEISSIPISKPVSDGKLVYVITDSNKMYALDAEDGRIVWIHVGILRPTAIFGSADPLIYKNFVIASYSSGEVYLVNKDNGETVWVKDLNLTKAINSDFYLTDIDATPVVKDDVIYAIGNGGLMMALKISDGSYLWKKEISTISDFWIAGKWIYVVDNADKLLAIQRLSGKVKWAKQLPHFRKEKKPQTKFIYNGVVLAGDKLLVSNSYGKLFVVKPENGDIEQEFSVGKKLYHAPIVLDNKIYFHGLGRYFISLLEIE